jgi:hypothetical protein
VSRRLILLATLVFIAMLGALTVKDVIHYGVTPLTVVSIMILVFFSIAIVGALRGPGRDE